MNKKPPLQKKIEDIYPLSPMQQGMLFETLHGPDTSIYVERAVYRLHGPLNIARFKQAWQQMMQRHAILRTLFLWEKQTEPLQIVRAQVDLPWTQQDWQHLAAGEQPQQLARFLAADKAAGFNLTQAPLMRLCLMQLDHSDHYFVWSFHHLLLDRWSVAVVLNELFTTYQALSQDARPALPPSQLYREYIIWLREQDALQMQVEKFWRTALQGVTTPTRLAVDTSPGRRQQPGDSFKRRHKRLSTATTAALQAAVRQQRLTLSTVVQAVWALLLGRYSRSDDVLFGATVSGRSAPLPGIDRMVGLLINTLPVRVKIPAQADTRLLDWLTQLQEMLLETRRYEQCALVDIHGWSDIPREQPLFDTLLVFENTPTTGFPTQLTSGLEINRVPGSGGQTGYPLTVVVLPEQALTVQLIYNCARFEEDTIDRLLDHFAALLEAVPGHLHQPVRTLPMLTAAEREQLLHTWNQTQADVPLYTPVHRLVEHQAQRTPHALAVAQGDTRLSYADLNRRANQLAHHLLHLGLSPGSLVALCLDRSPDFVMAALAVLKAGAAYLPLDPDYPPARLTFMLTDAQAALLISAARLDLPKLPNSRPVVYLDTDRPAIDARPTTNPASLVTANSLAYVIYTSGSTGQPKGVEIPQRGLLNLVAWHRNAYAPQPHDRATLLAPLAFDASVWELWPYLATGASLHLPPETLRTDPPRLLQWLAHQAITLAFLPTPLAEATFDLPWPVHSKLRALLTGGDRLRRYPPDSLPCPLFNHYGPTEYSVVTTWTAVSSADQAESQSLPPIGRPITNTRLYLLDAHRRLVPPGLSGELYIGGLGLATGYRHRPELTAERFVPNPFEPGQRLYKSGDLARYLPDGRLEFLGRVDDQLKIRGFRIEPGEIEHALQTHPAVRQALVLAGQNRQRQPQLAVYYIVDPADAPPAADDLRRLLRQSLPDYMIPAAFVALERWPLSPNGKIDRAALPDPMPEPAGPTEPAAAGNSSALPQTPTEEKVAAIWMEVLGLEQVGIHQNFFALGGQSLLAGQISTRLRDAFAVTLPLHTFFEVQTIANLAACIDARLQRADKPQSPSKKDMQEISKLLGEF